ncbi:hypothetical protein Tco_0380710, partial [Tanacetum coccineum]
VIPEELASSTGTLSSLQHVAKDEKEILQHKSKPLVKKLLFGDLRLLLFRCRLYLRLSYLSVTIHQDTSVIPPMTSPVIDLVSVPDSPTVHRPLPTTTAATATTTTTIITTIPPPPQPQLNKFPQIPS